MANTQWQCTNKTTYKNLSWEISLWEIDWGLPMSWIFLFVASTYNGQPARGEKIRYLTAQRRIPELKSIRYRRQWKLYFRSIWRHVEFNYPNSLGVIQHWLLPANWYCPFCTKPSSQNTNNTLHSDMNCNMQCNVQCNARFQCCAMELWKSQKVCADQWLCAS